MLRKEAKEKTQSFLCCHVDINRKVILYLFNVNSKQQAYRYHIGSLLGLLLFPKKTLSVWQKIFGIKNSCLRKSAKQRKSKLISYHLSHTYSDFNIVRNINSHSLKEERAFFDKSIKAYTSHKNNCHKVLPAHSMITISASSFCVAVVFVRHI